MFSAPPIEKDEVIIDLNKFRSPGVIVLSGRPKGESARAALDLDAVDRADGPAAKVVVDDEVVSINSSFFLGLFSPSVRLLGADGFRARYAFDVSYEIVEDVEDGIKQALRESNPLPSI